MRDKLTRRRSDSRSRSRSPDARYKSSSVRSLKRRKSPARSYSRQASSIRPPKRSPLPRVRSRSPQFRTPYSPCRRSGDDGRRGRSRHEERSSSHKYQPQASTSSTVVAGVEGEPSVNKMLKKIVAKTEKKKVL